jgi:hypothetical protein
LQQGVVPTAGNTVTDRFVGRLVPGSDRFNGAFQAGQGIDDRLQGDNAFRVSPRFGFAYDLTGKNETVVRGGFAILYDRPQGNQVFDMGANAPSVLVSTLQWGQLQSLQSAGGDPNPTLSLNPSGFDFKPPKTYAWNVGFQHKLPLDLIFDAAYVGTENRDQLRAWQLNAVPVGAKFLPQNQDPTRAPSATPGATALPDDLLRPYPGYGGIRMWDNRSFSNYHGLQTGLHRRFDKGLMLSAFYVWSKALTTEHNNDFGPGFPGAQCGPPQCSEEEIRRLDYSYSPNDRRHNFVFNFIYQTPKVAEGALGAVLNDWQISGVYHWMSGRPYHISFSIPGIGDANLTGGSGQPPARVVLTCDPGSGSSGDPYRQIANPECFAPPQPGSRGDESARFFLFGPALNNLDLSIAKSFSFKGGVRFEVRLDAFNALNHTQFNGVNATVNFASLTDRTITNLPYDSAGNLVRQNGFGSVNGATLPRQLQLVTRVTF